MGKTISEVILSLENLSYIELKASCFKALELYGIANNLVYGKDLVDEEKYQSCESTRIVLKKAANKASYYKGPNANDDMDLFKQIIEYPNITNIRILYSNGKCKNLYVPYDEHTFNSNGTNSYQESFINDDGDLEICIKGENLK